MNIQKIKQRLEGFGGAGSAVILLYLFGSRASGQAGVHSDYDVGILLDRGEAEPIRRARLAHELTDLLDTPNVDVVWLDQAPPELAFAVIQGLLLYGRDQAARVEFEAGVMGRYYDYLPYLRAQRAEILAGGDHAARVQRYRETLGRTERTLGQIRASQEKKPDRV